MKLLQVLSVAKSGGGVVQQLVSIDHDLLVKNVNEEFNQYMEYYMQLMKVESASRILIVEDDPISRKMIEVSIGQYNPQIQCFSAVSFRQALDVIRSVPCDFVIADYFLEGEETGLDLCDIISYHFPKTKCLIISQLKNHQYKEIAKYSIAPPEFVEKPVSIDFFKHYLESCLGGRHHVA